MDSHISADCLRIQNCTKYTIIAMFIVHIFENSTKSRPCMRGNYKVNKKMNDELCLEISGKKS